MTRILAVAFAFIAALLAASLSTNRVDADVLLKSKGASSSSAAKAAGGSGLKIAVALTFEKISSIINQFDVRLDARGVKKNTFLGDIPYDGTGRLGNVIFRASGSDRFPIEVTAPFKWKGQIKGFDVIANGDVTIDFGIRAGDDWCKLVEFDEPKVELVQSKAIDLAYVPFASEGVKAAIGGALGDLCGQVSTAASAAWHNLVFPLEFQGKTLFLNVDPKAISIVSASVQDNTVKLGMSLAFDSTLASKRPPNNKPKLPPPNGAVVSNPNSELEAVGSINLGLAFQ
ncbi:hypothetical protein [Bradyrhizobium diazoefficiens]|uniref:Uncharacterized protein n=1 Tax=Bradyrhizobium diazoefficiens TaxID=1355477 RepID=A0A809Y7F3_9BRAD|nr:hypothetical protein [Bradyrhizobium diazoefficiens]BBZ99866.1 hypothetical protein H12S4_07710 [Bradyrhizobium diazoefficiens]BCA17550.1 hypothetical protein BDHH15_07650 [Bradyrhizobium diazoefficiens]BCE35734.1 hypothetical protein XF3B_07650 [Bradyrhizobium diazoefficiens]BCF49127.1 hypothetical protein XF17B_07650 [Bradyrhizobium diazoefficiens]